MKRVLFLSCFFIIIISLFSCEKESPSKSSGKITLSTKKYISNAYYVRGYSFENNKFVDVVLLTTDADIAPVDSINLAGISVGIQFSVLSNNPNGFYLNAKFSDRDQADSFFKNYKKAEYLSYTTITPLLEAYDIFTLKTSQNNYVKFMITDVRQVSDFFEADLKFVIQKNGTDEFPD